MPSSSSAPLYRIGIICALPLERTAVEAVLDKKHDFIPAQDVDENTYSFGSIGPHNVVVASVGAGDYGTVSASTVASDIRRSFPSIKIGLMVGIAGGMPRPEEDDGDIRLGDVVVGCIRSMPSVINYRLGKETLTDFEIRSELAEPPQALQKAISALQTIHQLEGPNYLQHLEELFKNNPGLNRSQLRQDYYNQPDAEDMLYSGDRPVPRRTRYLRDPPKSTLTAKFITSREDGFHDYPAVHYGSIASTDTLMKSAISRDYTYSMIKKQRKASILCFEMEAAGIVKHWPCLVIRGICDYSDEHKNKAWQNFAAATAAAYAKDLLLRLPAGEVETAPSVEEVLKGEGVVMQNPGSGTQKNYIQSGGEGNRQFNAETMTFGSST